MSKNLDEARRLAIMIHPGADDREVETIQAALDAAERRGFERCREMAAEAMNFTDWGLELTVKEIIRALQYKEEE